MLSPVQTSGKPPCRGRRVEEGDEREDERREGRVTGLLLDGLEVKV